MVMNVFDIQWPLPDVTWKLAVYTVGAACTNSNVLCLWMKINVQMLVCNKWASTSISTSVPQVSLWSMHACGLNVGINLTNLAEKSMQAEPLLHHHWWFLRLTIHCCLTTLAACSWLDIAIQLPGITCAIVASYSYFASSHCLQDFFK